MHLILRRAWVQVAEKLHIVLHCLHCTHLISPVPPRANVLKRLISCIVLFPYHARRLHTCRQTLHRGSWSPAKSESFRIKDKDMPSCPVLLLIARATVTELAHAAVINITCALCALIRNTCSTKSTADL